MKTMLWSAVAFGAFIMAGATSAEAQSGYNSWRTVGVKTVSGRDSDTIQLRGDRRDRQIRICAFRTPIRMIDVDVRFENGRSQDLRVRNRINPGTCTRNIDLQGDRRNIASIRMRYEPIARGLGRPLVRVQAR